MHDALKRYRLPLISNPFQDSTTTMTKAVSSHSASQRPWHKFHNSNQSQSCFIIIQAIQHHKGQNRISCITSGVDS